MPLVKMPKDRVLAVDGKTQIILAVAGPFVRFEGKLHHPIFVDWVEHARGNWEEWVYKTGPIRKVQIVSEDNKRFLWFSWR